ncbi:MAG TPA: hypothetical protein VKZ81_05055 [Pseudonocardia sp.]|jgi:hypothetical protein|nr:hypothetical protein [Pseudonocardia sp.]HLU54809.1 hypothetical protein [Pseudonocardia sp.]
MNGVGAAVVGLVLALAVMAFSAVAVVVLAVAAAIGGVVWRAFGR